jgi:hypothetical protein
MDQKDEVDEERFSRMVWQKWFDLYMIQFLRVSPGLQILCEEADLIPPVKLRYRFESL